MQALWTNEVDVSLVNDHINQPVLNGVVFFGGFTGCSRFPLAKPQGVRMHEERMGSVECLVCKSSLTLRRAQPPRPVVRTS